MEKNILTQKLSYVKTPFSLRFQSGLLFCSILILISTSASKVSWIAREILEFLNIRGPQRDFLVGPLRVYLSMISGIRLIDSVARV